MITYIVLIVAELFLALWIKLIIPNKVRQEHLIAGIGMFLIFLLLALKKDTVGIDIASYKEQYEIAGLMPWSNFTYVYFEKGYLFLTKLFSKSGASFQLFMAFFYGIFCHSIYLLIKRFSPNATISLVIFICYQFLVFSISGVRQTMATALCIYAFVLLCRYDFRGILGAVLLNIAAITIHESSIVFLAILVVQLFMNRELQVSAWLLVVAAVFAIRPVLWRVVTNIYGVEMTAFTVGGSFLFLCGMAVFVSFIYFYYPRRRVVLPGEKKHFFYDAFLVRAVWLSLMCYIMFSGGTLLRANMYFNIFLIPGIPMAISKCEYRMRFVLNMAIATFLIVLFYVDTLVPNQLELWPYLFFWQ